MTLILKLGRLLECPLCCIGNEGSPELQSPTDNICKQEDLERTSGA